MRKYIYLFGIIYGFFTFMVGWNHMQDKGFEIFNIGMMAFTPVTGLILGYDWAIQIDKKYDKQFSIDKD